MDQVDLTVGFGTDSQSHSRCQFRRLDSMDGQLYLFYSCREEDAIAVARLHTISQWDDE